MYSVGTQSLGDYSEKDEWECQKIPVKRHACLRQQTLNLVLVRNAALGLSPDPASTRKGVPKYSDQEKKDYIPFFHKENKLIL